MINIIYTIFNVAWQQSAIVSVNDKDIKDFYRKIIKLLISFLFSGSFIIICLLQFLFKYIIDYSYYSAIYIIPFLLIGSIFISLAQFLGGILLSRMDTKYIGISTTYAAILNLVINLIFIKYIGIYAAAISTFISYFLLFIVRFMKLKEYFDNDIISEILKYVVVFIVFVAIMLINNDILNIMSLIISFCIFVIINKNTIKKIIFKFLKKGKVQNECANN